MFKSFKKAVTISLLPIFCSYSSIGCAISKRIKPSESFVEEVKEKNLSTNIIKKESVKYNITETKFNVDKESLEVVVNKDKINKEFKVGELITKDKYEISDRVAMIKPNKSMITIGGILDVFGSICLIAGLAGYQANKHSEGLDAVFYTGVVALPLGLFFTIVSYAAGTETDQKVIKKTYEFRNKRSEPLEELISSKILESSKIANVPLELNSDHFYFNQEKNYYKTVTDKDGKSIIVLKPIAEGIFLNKNKFYDLKLIKDLNFLGEKDTIKKILDNAEKSEYIIKIKTSAKDIENDEKEISIDAYKINEVLEEKIEKETNKVETNKVWIITYDDKKKALVCEHVNVNELEEEENDPSIYIDSYEECSKKLIKKETNYFFHQKAYERFLKKKEIERNQKYNNKSNENI